MDDDSGDGRIARPAGRQLGADAAADAAAADVTTTHCAAAGDTAANDSATNNSTADDAARRAEPGTRAPGDATANPG